MSRKRTSTQAFGSEGYKTKRRKRMVRKKPYYQLSLRGSRMTAIPDIMKVELYYDEQLAVLSAQSGALYVFAGNDCYDPDVTGTGHQPLGYDQWSAFYSRYRVTSSNIEVKLQRTSEACEFVVCPTPDTTATIVNIAEQPFSKIATVSSSVSNHKIKHYMSTMEILGLKSMEDDQISAGIGYSPNRKWYWVIGTYSYDSTTTITTHLSIRIKFYVEFYQRKVLGQS